MQTCLGSSPKTMNKTMKDEIIFNPDYSRHSLSAFESVLNSYLIQICTVCRQQCDFSQFYKDDLDRCIP